MWEAPCYRSRATVSEGRSGRCAILSRFCRPDVERPRRPPRAQSSEFRSVNVACVLMRNRTLRPVSDADAVLGSTRPLRQP